MTQLSCPDENVLAELAADLVSAATREKIVAHLDACSDCRELVALLAPPRLDDGSGKTTPLPSGPEDAPPSLAAGDDFGPYTIISLLGQGGMGEVYRAREKALPRVIALKIIRGAGQGEARVRFLREASMMARLNHPNIVAIYAVGEERGVPYVAMEHVPGRSLRALVEGGQLSFGEALAHAQDIAEALAEAHRRGVVHRDLKPENVLIARDGRARVLDFGLARSIAVEESSLAETIAQNQDILLSTATGVAGTPHYMAPEQWLARDPTPATDIWALGVMLFEMVAGELPFSGKHLFELSHRILSAKGPPAHAKLPAAVAELVSRCLDPDPAARPRADELLTQLRRLEGLTRFLASRDANVVLIEARLSLERAKALLASEGPASIPAFHALIEARFGLASAQKMRPSDAAIAAELDASIVMLVERDIGLRAPEGARALLTQLTRPREDLAQRVSALEREIAWERRAATEVAETRRQADTTRLIRPMTVVLTVVLFVAFAAGAYNAYRVFQAHEFPVFDAVVQDSVLAMIVLGGMGVAHKALFATAASRRLTLSFAAIALGMFMSDMLTFSLGGTTSQAVVHSLWVAAAGSAVLVVTTLRALWPSLPILFAGSLAALVVPRYAPAFALVSLGSTIVVFARAFGALGGGKPAENP